MRELQLQIKNKEINVIELEKAIRTIAKNGKKKAALWRFANGSTNYKEDEYYIYLVAKACKLFFGDFVLLRIEEIIR